MKTKVILTLILAFAVMQLFKAEKTPYQEPTDHDLFAKEEAPEQVKNLMKKICYDCHSDQVNYPWYSEVAPVSWWLQDHIEHGSEHLNFSKWGSYSAKKKAHKMEEAIEEVEEGEMPLPSYTFIHREGILSDEQKQMLIDWFKLVENKYKEHGSEG